MSFKHQPKNVLLCWSRFVFFLIVQETTVTLDMDEEPTRFYEFDL